jgi:hypothetical protein
MASRPTMQSCINQLMNANNLTTEMVQQEVEFLQKALENLRIKGDISNDSYLDAGAVEGGLSMLANLMGLGVSSDEINDHLRQLHERAGRIDEAHPTLGPSVAAHR